MDPTIFQLWHSISSTFSNKTRQAPPFISAMVSRWINGGFRREKRNSEKDDVPHCFVCSQFGIPDFHSTSCDPIRQQPAWEALAGSSLVPIAARDQARDDHRRPQCIPRVLDPRSERVLWWSRLVLLARFAALAVDPFFFFSLAVGKDGGGGGPCIYLDGRVARAVSVVRSCVDAMHLCHVWLQFRLAYVSRKSLVVGCGTLVWDARDIAFSYLRSPTGFWLDAFVLLPIPQVVYLWIIPRFLREEKISTIMIPVQLIFMLQFIPKVFHGYILMDRMRLVNGYIFGSIWCRIALSFMAYFLGSHVSGGYWYALAIQRVILCLTKQCEGSKKCSTLLLSCSSKVKFRSSMCLDEEGSFPYGIYKFAIPIISYDSVATRMLYSNLWGITSLRQENLCKLPLQIKDVITR
ncbi:hypothetical protein LXL04_013398 [Taraxacum kok-saghyz]